MDQTDRHTDQCANFHLYADGNGYSQADSHANLHRHQFAYSNTDFNFYAYIYAERYAASDEHRYSQQDSYIDEHVYSNQYEYADLHVYAQLDPNTLSSAHRNFHSEQYTHSY